MQSRFDSLASVPCRALSAPGQPVTSGTSTRRRVTERWVVLDGVNVKELIDTVRVPGRTTPLVHRSVLPCRD